MIGRQLWSQLLSILWAILHRRQLCHWDVSSDQRIVSHLCLISISISSRAVYSSTSSLLLLAFWALFSPVWVSMSFSIPLFIDVWHIDKLVNSSWTSRTSVLPLHFLSKGRNLAFCLSRSTGLIEVSSLPFPEGKAETGADADPNNHANYDRDDIGARFLRTCATIAVLARALTISAAGHAIAVPSLEKTFCLAIPLLEFGVVCVAHIFYQIQLTPNP